MIRRVLTLAVFATLFVSAPATATRLYWSVFFDRIERADLDGTRRETIASPVGAVHGLALDLNEGYLYVTVFHPVAAIFRLRRNGSESMALVTGGLVQPYGIALDFRGGRMYWTDIGTHKVQRANLDGTGVEDVVTGLGEPYGIVIDAEAGHIIWSDQATGRIQRASLDGTGVTTILTGLSQPAALAFDARARKLYWSEKGAHMIRRANVDGTAVEPLVTTGLASVLGLVLDLRSGRMYWSNADSTLAMPSRIQQATLDGASVSALFTFDPGFYPVAITLDPEIVIPTMAPWSIVILMLALTAIAVQRA